VGNKVALALSTLAVAVMLSACGGTQSGSATSESTGAGLRTAGGKHRATDPAKSCDAQGINSRQLGIGACTEGGVQYVVGNYGSVVRMRTLGVTIQGISVAGEITSANGQAVLPRRDAFLRVSLEVQNRDSVPHRFAFGQTMLGIGADNYLERADVERKAHAESLGHVNGGVIGPGETLRGDVIFDITRADYEVLQRQGRFFIWNFGEHAAATIRRGAGQVGQIRLYAVESS
jgi:hypothetical protein